MRKSSRWPFGPNKIAAVFLLLLAVSPRALGQDQPGGQKLAEQLCSAFPEENSEIHGTLHIRAGASRTNVPIVCKVEVTPDSWRTVYETGSERLMVVHFTNGPNQYFFAQAGGPTNAIAPAHADIPLAGSDFTLADLGLDFLHWPGQDERKGEMRLGQPCYVLDSSNPSATGIVRVRSFIDKQSGGIILADAYDSKGQIVKEFSLHGSFFRKVHGQWRLEKMEMSDKQKHSQTIIQFDMTP